MVVVGVAMVVGGLATLPLVLLGLLATGLGDYSEEDPAGLTGLYLLAAMGPTALITGVVITWRTPRRM